MAPRLILIRHPRTQPDPAVPASVWRLSPEGEEQVRGLVAAPFWDGVTAVYTSQEYKAAVVGEAVSAARGIPHQGVPDLREARRDGWLGQDAFLAAQRAFFAHPDTAPVPGWESAADAQARFARAMDRILTSHPAGESLAVVSHATVLTLYLAHLRGHALGIDDWSAIGFAAVMLVDRAALRPVSPFVPAPYTDLESIQP
jgi:broad specificity phosphatase PhoE